MLSGFNILLSILTDKRISLELWFNIYCSLLRLKYTKAIKSYCFHLMEHLKNTEKKKKKKEEKIAILGQCPKICFILWEYFLFLKQL